MTTEDTWESVIVLESDGGPGEHYELGLAGKGEASKNSPAAM